MPGALPVRGGAAAIQQPRFGQDVGARADAGDANTPRLAEARTKASTLAERAASRTPSPPATIKVEIAPADRNPRASHSTPEELRTAPGVSASTLIEEALPAKRPAISNTEIGPAASSS
jgi:hypothetical protein